ncbi:MAG TPA: hypothetical protein VGL76_00865 [Gaiellaceae bacterium]|jgi:TolB protein
MCRALPVLVLLLAGCGSSAGTIVFTSTRDGNAEVYVVRANGSGLRNLTLSLAQDGEPAWSPDGKQLAFVSARAGNTQVYVMNPDGSGLRRVTHLPTGDMAPVWSPDGSKIAFMCTTAIPRVVTEICVVDADGRNERQLTTRAEHDNLYPQWSPDGKRILFTSMRSGTQVYSVNASGGSERRLLPNVRGSAEAVYSPDGSQLAVLISTPRWVLDVLGANMTGLREVAGGKGDADSPAWSPNGKELAFDDGSEIYVVNADGSDRLELTHGPGASLSPRWSPDGKWLAFERTRGNASDVWIVRANGAGARDLTQEVGKNGGPVWQP